MPRSAPLWAVIVAIVAVLLIVPETVGLVSPNPGGTLSETVWWLLGLSSWIYWTLLIAFGLGATWLAQHFFGHNR